MTVVARRSCISILPVVCLFLVALTFPGYGQDGFIENRSYETLCAEADNINIPAFYTNTASYRVTASHPKFYPVAMDIRTPDFDDCEFAETRVLWVIGTNNGSSAEFLQVVDQPSYDYYAIDDPPAGIDQDWTNFPKEINNHTTTNLYIHFTAAESGDANTELTIGANLMVDLVSAGGTLQVRAKTWNGSTWVDQGSKYFSPSALIQVWSIPDFTWIEGVDSNTIHLEVVSTGSTVGAWALFDFVQLEKRGELGTTDYTLYNDGIVHVQAVNIDFWWRAPQSMTIGVIGGTTNYDAHYLRITRKEPSFDGYNEVFVLYEDGNSRIIPFPPVSLPSVPYGASVVLGPTVEGERPFAAIDTLTVDPKDLSIDIGYEGGATAHVELYVDREQNVIDVTEITYNTTTQSFARLRMWVYDGKADIDRVLSEDGTFPIMDGWTALGGTWWKFLHEVPSFHNTYCPDFSIEVLDSSLAFLSREAESFDSAINCTPAMRSNASGGTSVWLTAVGGEASFDIHVDRLYPETLLLLDYSDADGGDNGTNSGNRIDLYIDGSWTARTYSANTGGSNSFETVPSLRVGDLYPGDHTIRLVVGSGTGGMELDAFDLVSRPSILRATNSLVLRQGESVDSGSGYAATNRPAAVNSTSLVMSATGATANYAFTLPSDGTNLYMRLRHSDLWNPTRVEVSVDGTLVAKTPTMTEGRLYVVNDGFENGPSSGAAPDGWFKDGNCGQEDWAGEFGKGVAIYGWVDGGNGYFGQEVKVDSQYGDVFSFVMRGFYEPPFTSTTENVQLKVELWVRGEGSARAVGVYNAYSQLMSAPNTWQTIRVGITNTVPEIDMVKIVADFAGVTNFGGAIKWDGPQLCQSSGAGPGYFMDAGLMFLGDVAAGSHTVTLTSAAETLGLEVDEIEIIGLSRSNRMPTLMVPAGFSIPVGSSTSFVVHVLEYDPDPVTITVTSAPATSAFMTNLFSWTVDAASCGTTNDVWFVVDDQQGYANSQSSSEVEISVPYDSDTDDMSDGWEWDWFTTLVHTAEADFDGDELNNLGESVSGMNPRDSNSYFMVGSMSENLIATGRTITVDTEPGRQYSIYYTDSLDPVSWNAFGNPDVGVWHETSTVSTAHTFIDDESTNTTDQAPVSGVRFYSIDVTYP